MPSITFTSAAALVANIHVGEAVHDPTVEDLGDRTVAVTIADDEISARIIGPADIVHSLIIDLDRDLTALSRGTDR